MNDHIETWIYFAASNPHILKEFHKLEVQFVDRFNKSSSIDLKVIFDSLVNLGIPVKAIEAVLQCLYKKLLDTNGSNSVTSDELRKHIANCLLDLDSSTFKKKETEKWSNSYIYRYGIPGKRLLIIDRDRNLKVLDYNYLKTSLLPKTICYLLRMNDSNLRSIVSGNQLTKMASHLMDVIKSLKLSTLCEDTLQCIVRDHILFSDASEYNLWPSVPTRVEDELKQLVSEKLDILIHILEESKRDNNKLNEQMMKEINDIHLNLVENGTKWRKVIGGFVIIASLISGIADMPQAVKVVDDALEAIAKVFSTNSRQIISPKKNSELINI